MARTAQAASAQAPLSPFAAELELVTAALDDESLTAKGAAKLAAQRVAAMEFPAARAFQVKDLLMKFAKEAATLISNDDHVALRQATGRLYTTAR
jgi:hypothetical protein